MRSRAADSRSVRSTLNDSVVHLLNSPSMSRASNALSSTRRILTGSPNLPLPQSRRITGERQVVLFRSGAGTVFPSVVTELVGGHAGTIPHALRHAQCQFLVDGLGAPPVIGSSGQGAGGLSG